MASAAQVRILLLSSLFSFLHFLSNMSTLSFYIDAFYYSFWHRHLLILSALFSYSVFAVRACLTGLPGLPLWTPPNEGLRLHFDWSNRAFSEGLTNISAFPELLTSTTIYVVVQVLRIQERDLAPIPSALLATHVQ